jgi:integrase
MYDYFGFLESRELDWRSSLADSNHSVIAAYRDWSVDQGLATSTINGRLRTIIKFYLYARRQHWIEKVPYDIETIIINNSKGFFAHTNRLGNKKNSPNVMLKEKVKCLDILTKEEVKQLIKHKTFISQHLIYRMALQTGMRKEELLTITENCIQHPYSKRGSSVVRIRLDPNEMKTKGSKERDIDIPLALYERLWQYKIYERHQLMHNNNETDQQTLFLNRFGKAYSVKGSTLNNELKKITGRNEISLHKLRHTYATFMLYNLRSSPNYRGDPLVYIQDRLGHSSILTTQIYLHYIDSLEGDVMTQYDQDIDQICLESVF